jgi:type II secretion system protein H
MAASEATMISPIGNNTASNRAAFTLIELILVMTIIMIVVGVAAPNLKGFFKGRNLDNDARQFLSLTRLGQSRAITEGIPVELWINSQAGSFGLQALSGYSETQTNPVIYNVDKTVAISCSKPSAVLVHSNYWTPAQAQFGLTTKIRFQPDGFISDNSPQDIYFTQDDGSGVWIEETPSHTRYDIQTGKPKR